MGAQIPPDVADMFGEWTSGDLKNGFGYCSANQSGLNHFNSWDLVEKQILPDSE